MHAKPELRKAVSISAVAQLANCSEATVSNVVTKGRRVGRDKELAVLRAIDELGYRVHAVARNLRTHRSEIIGVIFSSAFSSVSKSDWHADVVEGIQAALSSARYDVLVARATAGGVHGLCARVDGLIVVGDVSAEVKDLIIKSGRPVVFLGADAEQDCDSVTPDLFQGYSTAIERLVPRGTGLAVLMADSSLPQSPLHEAHFCSALLRKGLPIRENSIIRGVSRRHVAQALQPRFRDSHPPVAIITTSLGLGNAVTEWMDEQSGADLRPIGVAAFDEPKAPIDDPVRTARLYLDHKRAGELLATSILARIEDPGRPILNARTPFYYSF